MSRSRRSLLSIIIALATLAALSGVAIASVDRLDPRPGNADLHAASSVWDTGAADGAGIPGPVDGKPDKPSSTGTSALLFVGAGLIALAFLGKRILQK